MGGWVARWVHVTLRLNPILPLSALALLVGTYLLTQGQSIGGGGVAQTLAGIAILEGFELCLLGTAAFVLWPRRISYETVTILVMRGVLRFAPPFLVLGLAADGEVWTALAIGVGLVALAAFKSELANRRLDLGLTLGARLYDLALYASVTLLLPLLADRLPVWTGDLLTLSGARLVQMGAWWIGALALMPLALGLDGLGAGGPEGRFRHTVAGRCVTLACTVGLLFNALWLGGNPPLGLALVPLILVAAVFFARLAPEGALPRWLVHAPSALVAGVVLSPAMSLVGPAPIVSHLGGCLAALLLALGAVPLISTRHQRAGLRSLSLVAGLAPLRFVGGWAEGEAYLAVVAATFLALGLLRRSDRLTTLGACVSAVIGGHLAWSLGGSPAWPIAVLSLLGAGLALASCRLLPGDSLSGRVAVVLCVGSSSFAIVASAPGIELCAELCATAGLAWYGLRQRKRAVPWIAGALSLALVGRCVAAAVPPGVFLVLLAFAGIPAGTALAIQRERRGRSEGRALGPVQATQEVDPPQPSTRRERRPSAETLEVTM